MNKLQEYIVNSLFMRNQIDEPSFKAALSELSEEQIDKFLNTIIYGKQETKLLPVEVKVNNSNH